jgi:hypothetical protein
MTIGRREQGRNKKMENKETRWLFLAGSRSSLFFALHPDCEWCGEEEPSSVILPYRFSSTSHTGSPGLLANRIKWFQEYGHRFTAAGAPNKEK